MKKLVLFYLCSFLVLDSIMGFLLVFMGLQDVLIINPGQLVRTLMLVLILTVLIKDALKRLNSLNSRILLVLVYFGLFTIFVFLKNDPTLEWTAEIGNTAKLIFVVLLFYYVQKHKKYFAAHLDTIMSANFWVLTANLVFSYITGFGISTYGEGLGSTKGFLYAGNSVSILSLVFFAYFFFKIEDEKKAKYLCLLAVFDIYVVGTKAIFIVPFIILIFLAKKIRWTRKKIGIAVSVASPLIVSVIILIQPLVRQVYQNKYAKMIQQTGLVNSGNEAQAANLTEALLIYRRTSFAIEQVTYQFSDVDGLIFGYGNSGQNRFWSNTGYGDRLKFAGMDFIDFLFEYGVIGSILFYSIFFYAFYCVVKRRQFTALTVSFTFIFLYSFFGGYVLYDSTAGTMFAFLTALVYPKIKEKN